VPLPEPIVRDYFFELIPILCVILPVPALTMRLLAEEKQTGSLEVLMTAPVNEWPVVLSKFLATWIFFMICWLPAGLFLIAIRMEAGAPFDYRPLLSFYAALAACGAAFIALGMLFSSLTSDQIIAAMLTFLVMMGLVVCYFVRRQVTSLDPNVKAFLSRLSFIDLWAESLQGQLPIRDVLVWASAAVFALFVTVKVLEARKWK
jgi:ABC-2 type transport system permease protein